MTAQPVIGYAGLTHLGLCSAVAAASKGFHVVAFDPDPLVVKQIESGRLPVIEPNLDQTLRAHRSAISLSADPSCLATCDVVYIAPDVPTDDAGTSDLRLLRSLLEIVLPRCRSDAIAVVLSQVPPGFTRTVQCNGLQLYYQVETLVFGRAVERAIAPERFIVGCSDPKVALPPALIAFLKAFDCPILPMKFESAEFTKISINCCLAASISVSNTLAEICEQIGADWFEIAPALRLDKRIGAQAYLTPGLGLAGGNIERDLRTVVEFSTEHGTDGRVIHAFIANSAHRKDWALRLLHKRLLGNRPDATIGILGLAYKENTDSIKNSPSLALIRELGDWTLRVFDPAVSASAAAHSALIGTRSALEAAEGADCLAIMTPWPEFRSLSAANIAKVMRGRLVLDPYRLVDPTAARRAGLEYHTLGTV